MFGHARSRGAWLTNLMDERASICVIVGSLRSGSVNRAIARAAAVLAPADVALRIHSVADVPLYNGDVEERGIPAAVRELHDAVAESVGVLFFTPEYNGSLPAVLKNVIDWLSRPPHALEGKPFAAVATTPGSQAGAGVLGHIAQIFDHMQGTYLRFDSLGIGAYGDKLDEAGELADATTRAELADWLARFAEFAKSSTTA